MTFVRVRQARVPTASRTIRKRSHSLANVRTALSAGDDTSQFAHELHSFSRKAEDRQRLMEEMRHVTCSVESSVAMKAEMEQDESDEKGTLQNLILHVERRHCQ